MGNALANIVENPVLFGQEDHAERWAQLDKMWLLYDANLKNDSKDAVSVLAFNSELAMNHRGNTSWDPWEGAMTMLTILRTHRHPYLPVYVDSVVVEKKKEMYIVIEPVWPLLFVIRSLSSVELILTLADAARGLTFMHELGYSHNNFGFHSILMTRSKHMRSVVSGWEFSGPFYSARTRDMLLQTKTLRASCSVTPEEEVFIEYGELPIHTRDVCAFARLLDAVLQDDPPAHVARRKHAKRPTTFRSDCHVSAVHSAVKDWVRRATLADPVARSQTTLGDLMMLPLFNHSTFLKVTLMFDELQLLPKKDKVAFLQRLHWELLKIPYDVLVYRVLPRLLSFPLLCDRDADVFMPHLLTPMSRVLPTVDDPNLGLLPMEVYQESVVPFIIKCINLRRRDTYYAVLRHTQIWLPLVHPDTIIREVLPALLEGLTDANDNVVHASIEAAAYIAVRYAKSQSTKAPLVVHFTNEFLLPELRDVACHDKVAFLRLSAANAVLSFQRLEGITSLYFVSCFVSVATDVAEGVVEGALEVLEESDDLVEAMPETFLTDMLPYILPMTLSKDQKVRHYAHRVLSRFYHVTLSAVESGHTRAVTFPPLLMAPPTTSLERDRVRRGRTFCGALHADTDDEQHQQQQQQQHADVGGLEYDFTDDYDEEWNTPGVLSGDSLPDTVARLWDSRHTAIHPFACLLPTRSIYPDMAAADASSFAAAMNHQTKKKKPKDHHHARQAKGHNNNNNNNKAADDPLGCLASSPPQPPPQPPPPPSTGTGGAKEPSPEQQQIGTFVAHTPLGLDGGVEVPMEPTTSSGDTAHHPNQQHTKMTLERRRGKSRKT
eukprot:PhM_4_TR7517/c0_g1_i1/m.31565/K17542/SCYL3; SCY1-like protein 3